MHTRYRVQRVWNNYMNEFHVMAEKAQWGDGAFAVCDSEVNVLFIANCLNQYAAGKA